jgi:hypothetical protein
MSFWGIGNTVLMCPTLSRPTNKIGAHNIDILSFFYGTLLGDSYGEKRSNSTRITFQQENSNMEYLMWFHKYVSERGYCNPMIPKLYTRIAVNNKVRFYYKIRTYSYPSLNWLHNDFYGAGTKTIPRNLNLYFTPLSLAVLIMDDGAVLPNG